MLGYSGHFNQKSITGISSCRLLPKPCVGTILTLIINASQVRYCMLPLLAMRKRLLCKPLSLDIVPLRIGLHGDVKSRVKLVPFKVTSIQLS